MARKRASSFVADDSEEETSSKPTSTSNKKAKLASLTNKDTLVDTNEDPYWELSGKRRVVVTKYSGKMMINVREYYEKDGKSLPGKKGITLSMENYAALVKVLPAIEKVLKEKGENVPRPKYEGADDEEEDGDEDIGEEEESDVKPTKKSNIETTSEEEQDEED